MPYRLRQLIQNPLGGCKRGLIDICSFHREKKAFFFSMVLSKLWYYKLRLPYVGMGDTQEKFKDGSMLYWNQLEFPVKLLILVHMNKIFSRKIPVGFYKVLTNFYIFSGDNQIFRKEMSSGLSFFHLVNSFIRVV